MADSTRPADPQQAPRWLRLLSALLLAALATLPCWGLPLFCLSYPVIRWWYDRVPFDPAAWRATEDPSARYDMSWDLVHGNILTGKTPAEVEHLRGKPMETDTFGSVPLPMFSAPHFRPGVVIWYYDLGAEKHDPGLGPSGAVLAVDFEGGKVVRARKVVHSRAARRAS